MGKGTALYALFLAVAMLTFGTVNTVFGKYQNLRSFYCPNETYDCEKCPSEYEGEGVCIPFEQPVFQTFNMFVGELVCLFVFFFSQFLDARKAKYTGVPVHHSKLHGWKKLIFAVPTICDLIATTLMNLGLIYTFASVYQMLRGIVVVFTGILSVFFLKRKQTLYHWAGIVLVVIGVGVVGLASVLFGDDSASASDPLLGDVLIISAQVFSAFQFVFEEKYLAQYEVSALEAVGYEGLYGVLILVVGMPLLQIYGNTLEIGNSFDSRFAFEMFLQFPSIWVSSVGTVFSIAFFNSFGMTITKILSATARSTIDACRTLSVWIVGLIIGWEVWNKYTWVQIVGFVVLILGTFLYNKVIKLPCFKYEEPPADSEETKPLKAPLESDSDAERNEKYGTN